MRAAWGKETVDRAGRHKMNKVYKNEEPVDKAGGDIIECALMLGSELVLGCVGIGESRTS